MKAVLYLKPAELDMLNRLIDEGMSMIENIYAQAYNASESGQATEQELHEERIRRDNYRNLKRYVHERIRIAREGT